MGNATNRTRWCLIQKLQLEAQAHTSHHAICNHLLLESLNTVGPILRRLCKFVSQFCEVYLLWKKNQIQESHCHKILCMFGQQCCWFMCKTFWLSDTWHYIMKLPCQTGWFHAFSIAIQTLFKLRFRFWDCYKILYMPWQLCCHGMCKIVLQSGSQYLNFSKAKFPIKDELRTKDLQGNEPRTEDSWLILHSDIQQTAVKICIMTWLTIMKTQSYP